MQKKSAMHKITTNYFSKESFTQPDKIEISSMKELNQKLNEGLSDIEDGRVIPADVVNKCLHDKFRI